MQRTCLIILACVILLFRTQAPASEQRPPNIIYIYADDLGYAELGCYGQQIIKTPHIDKLASRGIRLTQHYSGSPVCAPSRCVVMTGKDTGRSYIRNNSEWGADKNPFNEGQEPLKDSEVTLAELLQQQGYRTAVAGKWGLGGPTTQGIPTKQGFDDFFGYHCQRQSHSYYPDHLWHNEAWIQFNDRPIPGHQRIKEPPEDWSIFEGEKYAPQAIADHMLDWIGKAADDKQPFFFWYTTIIPHVSLHIPSAYIDKYGYADTLDKKPYLGDKGYTPSPRPHAAYAAMITYLDEQVGRIVALLEEKGIADNTLIVFSSDNGTTFNGGVDAEFFRSVGDMRGLKASVFEGGIKVPMIAVWPGRIASGTTSDLVCAQVDILPTLLEAAGGKAPEGLDGVSLLPTLTGMGKQRINDFYYWELGRQQAIRHGDWKLVRAFDKQDRPTTYLFNLANDPNEAKNLAVENPERLHELIDTIIKHRTEPMIENFRYEPFSSPAK